MRLVGNGSTPRAGTYRSSDGTIYTVLGVAEHIETGDQLIVCLFQKRLRAYPIAKFMIMLAEKINVNGKHIPKFEFIDKLQIQ